MASDAQAIIDVIAEEIEHVGWSKTARRSGYNRGWLHHTFGPTRRNPNPGFRCLCDVADALGMTIQVVRE